MSYEVTLTDLIRCDPILGVCYRRLSSQVTDAPTIPVSTKENLGDPIDIRVDIIHPKPVVGVAFSAAAVVTTLACHEEAIRGIYKHFTKTRESQTRRCRRYDQEGYTEGEVEDGVMLKVLPWKGVVCFGKWGKLNPRYVGPFQVLAKVRAIAYKLELPQELSRVYNTFHVSNLKKCYADVPLAALLDGLHIDDKLHFVEEPVEIMDREVKRLRQSCVPIIKIRWNSRRGPEFTWEREDQFTKKHPHLFTKTAPSSSATS
ncbi:hypothetical protein Tco_1111653 [Tanacetum coccineum]|uniref:Tf2-1-like SH3-like domain-containing protein n=1 Tax=Tanacetum coccineum TaxID=301880 RepID=A0ABQ5INQ0_9ASTR